VVADQVIELIKALNQWPLAVVILGLIFCWPITKLILNIVELRIKYRELEVVARTRDAAAPINAALRASLEAGSTEATVTGQPF
jgi:hypothetical protein